MRYNEIVAEITKPVGTIYLRFKERTGEVPANASKEEKDRAKYLTAFVGFANDPESLTTANARLKFNKLNSMEDIVGMVKSVMADKVFISAKSMTVYVDLSEGAYNRHPFLEKFLDWAEANGGDRIKVDYKVPTGGGEQGPKKKAKPNPMKGKKIRDVDAAEPSYTVTFSVDDRFYREVERTMPNLMQYRGPNKTFVMKDELFRQFRELAKQRFPGAEIKVIKRVATEDQESQDRLAAE